HSAGPPTRKPYLGARGWTRPRYGLRMPWYVESVKKLGSKKWFSTVGKRFAPGFDRAVIKLSGGRLRTGDKAAIPTLLLTCTGRKSGRERQTPLLFLRDGENFVVAGSNWGQQHDPA